MILQNGIAVNSGVEGRGKHERATWREKKTIIRKSNKTWPYGMIKQQNEGEKNQQQLCM